METNQSLRINKSLLYFAGIAHILIFILHLFFWRLFDWSAQLALLSVVNSNIMQMLNCCMVILFTGISYLLVFEQKELLTTRLGKMILVFLSLFWLARLVMEFVFPGGDLVFGLFLLLVAVSLIIPRLNAASNLSKTNNK
ncbi:MAG: hypothetical protein OCD76_03585 [Reichenbachiella sp.]